MEDPLWRENLGSLGSHDARNLLVACAMATDAGKKPPASTLYIAQGGDGSLSPTIEYSTRHWLDPLARAKYNLLLKTHDPSERELADKTAD